VITIAPMPEVGVERQQRGAELVHQLIVQRVELLGPVQRDQADAVAGIGKNALIGHAGILCLAAVPSQNGCRRLCHATVIR
jgi:hypothetical protein